MAFGSEFSTLTSYAKPNFGTLIMFRWNMDIAELVSTNKWSFPKNGHFPNHKFPWNKISKFSKIGKSVTFLTMASSDG